MHGRAHELRTVLAEALRGKAVGRTLTNIFWKGCLTLSGHILDIGGAGRASHYRFLTLERHSVRKVVDIVPGTHTDYVLDITREQVPLPAGSQNYVLMFNILEHLYEHARVLAEVRRLLVPGGKLVGTIPFLINVHPDPHDYVRFTKEALVRLFEENGFTVHTIQPIGRGPFLAAYEQLDMLIWSPLHVLFCPIIWSLDTLLSLLRPTRDFRSQFPIAYNFIAEKEAR